MKTKDNQTKLQAIAALTLDVFTRLSREGKPLDLERLTAALQASEELKNISADPLPADNFQKNEILRLKKELKTLHNQYDKVGAKRRELAVQLDTAEDINSRNMVFIQRAVPVLAQLARSGRNKPLHEHLDRITDLLKRDAPLDDIENELQKLKETTFRGELEKEGRKTSSPRTSAIFNLFKRQAPSGKTDSVGHFKSAYMDIVEELRLNLDQAAMVELAEIKTLISDAIQVDEFHPVRQKILALLKKYISRISAERSQAAAFIFEVGERLLEIEKQVFRSIAVAEESRNASTQLTDTIEKEMVTFQETVDFTTSLEELKSKIIDRISAIKKIIEDSRQEDLSKDIFADREVSVLKKNLNRMKTEIQSAKKRSQVLEAELMSDPLTQAYNRRAYDQRIVDELERFLRYQTIFSMLLLDVDHFKDINDQYGHSVGDLCLKEIINRIKPLLRKPDFLARFGGEEFVIIMPETGRDGARKVAEKIRMYIEKTDFLHKGENVKVTISLGGTQVQASDKTDEEIFNRVDKAMYQAKQSGRNRVVMM